MWRLNPGWARMASRCSGVGGLVCTASWPCSSSIEMFMVSAALNTRCASISVQPRRWATRQPVMAACIAWFTPYCTLALPFWRSTWKIARSLSRSTSASTGAVASSSAERKPSWVELRKVCPSSSMQRVHRPGSSFGLASAMVCAVLRSSAMSTRAPRLNKASRWSAVFNHWPRASNSVPSLSRTLKGRGAPISTRCWTTVSGVNCMDAPWFWPVLVAASVGPPASISGLQGWT